MNKLLIQEWLKSAYADIVVLDSIINNEFITHMSAFHSQQTIEKSLKAYLLSKNYEVQKIHSLHKLFSLCKDFDIDKDFDLIQLLDSLYIESRYPSEMGLLPYGKPTLSDAKEFYAFARNIFDQICTKLNIQLENII